jgi:sugar porter (SP) family MFS transporter
MATPGGAPTPSARPGAGSTGRISLVAGTAAIGGFLFGFDTAVINGAVTPVQAHFQAGAVELGLAVSSALIGSAVGAVVAGRLADRIGRVRAMWVAALLFLVQSFGVGLSVTLADFSAWRFVGGVAVGAASVLAPAYIAEVAPAHLRGRLGSLQQLAIVTGIFIALLVDFFVAFAAGGAARPWLLGLPAWRWMFLSEAIPSLIYLAGTLRLPESPRYLVGIGNLDDARRVLVDVVGRANVEAKVAEIRQTIRTERRPRLSDLRGGFGVLPIVWVGIGLSIFQQFVGINVIFYYSSVLWLAVGFTEQQSLLITVITSVTNIATTFIAIGLVDRVGRKPLLLVGSAGMVVTLGAMAFLFGTAPLDAKGQPVLHGVPGFSALVAANLYVVFFGLSWGPVVWVLLGEMFPNRIRAAALSVGAAAQWLANWAVSTSFPTLKNVGLGYAYGLYAVMAVLSLVFVASFVRETRGRELETMTERMGGPTPPRRPYET